mmetsp:Transcript_28707/g.45798  ORF Transcript_28707/g.45798 Transcript_28707/m.45798 type:complete len:304 (+) Transcript_28707:4520-5431(+)
MARDRWTRRTRRTVLVPNRSGTAKTIDRISSQTFSEARHASSAATIDISFIFAISLRAQSIPVAARPIIVFFALRHLPDADRPNRMGESKSSISSSVSSNPALGDAIGVKHSKKGMILTAGLGSRLSKSLRRCVHSWVSLTRSPPSPFFFPISYFIRFTRFHHSHRMPNTSLHLASLGGMFLTYNSCDRCEAGRTMRVCLRIAAKAERHTGSDAILTLRGSSMGRKVLRIAARSLAPSPVSSWISLRKATASESMPMPLSCASMGDSNGDLTDFSSLRSNVASRITLSSGMTPALIPPLRRVQ